MIRLENVSKTFDQGATWAVRHVSLHVEKGETLVLLGSSGCGKTTTLRLVNRLLAPTEGTVVVAGRDVAQMDPVQLRRSIGYVFQGIGLFPHMTVEENVAVVLRIAGRARSERRARARELLALVDLDPAGFGHRYPRALSGGQQQRVGVARALAAEPEVLLMDEPFGALDAMTRDGLQRELKSLKGRIGKTIVFVTHDIFEALSLADRLAVMHEGHLQQVGSKEDVLGRPATDFVRKLFQKPARQLRAFQDHFDAKPDAG